MATLVGTKRGESFNGTADADIIQAGAGNDFLFGQGGDDSLYGEAGDDELQGGFGNDHLYGGDGRDRVFGQIGDDYLEGGAGNDDLWGGPGIDVLFGGSGADLFKYGRFTASENGDAGGDTIGDFETGIDKIDLSHFDANTTTPIDRSKRQEAGNESFQVVTATDEATPGHLTLTFDPVSGYTTLNAYWDTVVGADFTLQVFGQVNSADIVL